MWFVYILECRGKRFYTGITNDPDRRLRQHKQGKGGRFTRAFGVKKILYQESHPTKSAALRREIQIKRWSRREKLVLIKGS